MIVRGIRDLIRVSEKADDGSYSADVPDLPGCTSAGDEVDEVKQRITEAVSLYLGMLPDQGALVPSVMSAIGVAERT